MAHAAGLMSSSLTHIECLVLLLSVPRAIAHSAFSYLVDTVQMDVRKWMNYELHACYSFFLIFDSAKSCSCARI